MLDEESQRVTGYVDTLRETIVLDSQQREKAREAGEGWANDVREALGSSRVMEAVHRSEALMATRVDVDFDVQMNTETMERKGRKADHGYALAAEIKGLLVDVSRWP
jgi:hypothetical protein